MYLATVDWATSKPNLSSSPWMRGAPHNGFAWLMWRIRARNSVAALGLPTRLRDRQRQIGPEAKAMPAQRAIDICQRWPLGHPPAKHVELVPQDQNLSLQFGS
jgi:hypothetical protein